MTNFSEIKIKMHIPFNKLPDFSELFTDYIDNFGKLKKYYEYDFRNYEEIFKCIEFKKETYLSGKNFFRNDITGILTEQNTEFGSGEKTLSNIKLLNDPETFAIVTGQQLGILTGPFYTILKAINTIQLAELLNQKFKDFKFVPVFWMEADDHDFREINNVNLLTGGNEIRNIKYFEKGEEQEKYLKPVSELIYDDFISAFTDEEEKELIKTDFTQDLFDKIRRNYKPGNKFVNSFAGFMNSILKDKGLILINPSDAKLKKLLKPVFEKELNTAPQSCEAVINTTVELEESYSAQIKPKVINLFYIHDGNRYLLEPRENDIFALKHSRQKFSKEELYSILESNPERFSWNVVTRPVCQDYILPTVAYIGGPSEIAYFAQLKNAYKVFNDTMPVIYPRTSVTFLENRVKSFMDKYGVSFEELFDMKELSRKLLAGESEPDVETVFSDMKEKLTGVFYTVEKELSKIDLNQTNSFSKRNQQFLDSLNIAKEKYLNLQTKQNEVVSNKLKMVNTAVYPDNSLQERVFNICYFLNKYSFDFIERLFQGIAVDEFSHQVLMPDSEQKKSE